MLGKQRSRPHGIRRESELVKWTRTPLYILHSAVEAGKFSGEIQPDFSKIAYS